MMSRRSGSQPVLIEAVELYVRIVDKVHPTDLDLSEELFKSGEVIAICPDGWNWTETERSSLEHRIVQVPDALVGELDDLLEMDIDPVTTRIRRRVRRLNLRHASFSAGELEAFDSAKPRMDIALLSARIREISEAKPISSRGRIEI